MTDPTNLSWLIVGLGNPGTEYKRTRHNAGFSIISILAEELGVELSVKEQFVGEVKQTRLGSSDIVLCRPLTFMNDSGITVSKIAKYHKIPYTHIIIIHDDIDLPLGTIKFKVGGSSGGHNGIKSIIASLGTEDFVRIRIGVGKPPKTEDKKASILDWVLGKHTAEEMFDIEKAYKEASQLVYKILIDRDYYNPSKRDK